MAVNAPRLSLLAIDAFVSLHPFSLSRATAARFNSLAHFAAPFEDEARANVLAMRHFRDHRARFRNGRESPRPVLAAPSPAALGAGYHRHSSHAAQLTSLIKPP